MADIVTQRNIAAYGDLVRLTDHSTATAGGTGAATTVTGISIDREGYFSTGSLPRSAEVAVLYEATLQSGATISLGYAVQNSTNNSTWSDYQTATWAVANTWASGGSVVKGEFNIAVNLDNAMRYVRFNYNPEFSSTGTDTLYADGAGFFAGFDILPGANN
nr:hypothetical protein [uncultured Rhodopila sp.]